MGIAITEKLGKSNHAMWKVQILAAVRGSRLVGHLTGTSPAPAEEVNGKDSAGKDTIVPNPAFEEWYSRDQQVLSFVLGSLGHEVLAQVAAQDTAANLWAAIEAMYASQNRARVVNTRLTLATAQKGNQTITEYVGKMRTLGDEMVAAGRPVEDDDLLTYILTGLDVEFNPVVTSLLARKEPVTVSEAYSQLLAFQLVWRLWAVATLDLRPTWPIEEVVEALVVVMAILAAAVVKDEDGGATSATPTTPTSARTTMEEVLVVATRAVATQATPSRCAKSASKPVTLRTGVGTGLRRTMSLKKGTPVQP